MRKAELSSHLFKVWFFRVAVICSFALLPQNLYGDGKYFPGRAYKVPPDIPSQRAIIIYKDGIEELTIESALNGEGQEFGWIIPLPAKPIKFEEASPGLIKTLALVLQPKIIHDLTESVIPLCIITVIITLGCLMSITKTPKKRLNRFLLLLLITLISSCFLMPHLGVVRTAGIKTTDILGIKLHEIQEIGSYELAVLEADNADALDEWLSSNGFAGLTDKDKKIVNDYISGSWFFVAAKLRREGSGYSRPHPLTMTFPSKMPIYPIRLTATVGSNVYLELFVIAEKQADCRKLTLEISDRYRLGEIAGVNPSGKGFLPGFVGETYRQNIGHPKAKEQMWDGCVLSKLSGTLTPDDMAEDIILDLKSANPYQKYYFSRPGANETGLIASLVSWCFIFVILTAVFGSKSRKESEWRQTLFRITVIIILFSLLIWGFVYVALPKVDVQAISFVRLIKQRGQLLQDGLTVAQKYGYPDNTNIDEAIRFVDDYFISKNYKNIYTGEKIQHEDSPGNYTVFENERGIVLRIYSREGYPYDVALASTPKSDEE
jgi:hypothetical protein